MKIYFGSCMKGVLLLLLSIASIVTAIVWINSTAEPKVRDIRNDLSREMMELKQDLTEENKDTQAALLR
jgi:hypothetical protein